MADVVATHLIAFYERTVCLRGDKAPSELVVNVKPGCTVDWPYICGHDFYYGAVSIIASIDDLETPLRCKKIQVLDALQRP